MSQEQMARDGISRILPWTKPRKVGCAMMRFAKPLPQCGHVSCAKRAGYRTPIGNRCFTHVPRSDDSRARGEQS